MIAYNDELILYENASIMCRNFFDRKKKVREEKAIERDHNLDTYVSSGMTLAIVHRQFMNAIQLISCVKKRIINN